MNLMSYAFVFSYDMALFMMFNDIYIVIYIVHIEIQRVFMNIYSIQLLVANNDRIKSKLNEIESN